MESIVSKLIEYRKSVISNKDSNYKHIACIFEEKEPIFDSRIIGINYTFSDDSSIHAECDAIRKLRQNKDNKRKIKIDILVIRYNENDNLCSSDPCINCLYNMYFTCANKGYIVRNIYYSTKDRTIEKRKLTNMVMDKEQHMSHWDKVMGKNNRTVEKMENHFGVKYEFA